MIAGRILDRNGVVLAETAEDGTRVYQADETARRAVVHLLGDPQGHVANGVETFQTGYLYGFHATLPELLSIRFTGGQRVGDDVTLTIDSQLCTAIYNAFQSYSLTRGHNGAAVVLNYRTGEVVGMVSLGTFDPMGSIVYESGSSYYWNRATQGLYPPGSTFKVITTVAALENIDGAAEAIYQCLGGLEISTQTIHDFGSASHGELTLKQAFTKSCNITYAKLALNLPDGVLRKTAQNFGFGDNFLFRDIVVENSSFATADGGRFHVALSGFGQSELLATPLHMCLVAAGIANDGLIMEPTLLRQVTSGVSGAERDEFLPREYKRCTTPETAAILQEYMRAVCVSGTGTRANVSGMTICGKTGSAEAGANGLTHGWFIGFCADEAYPFAVCVLVENIGDGNGGGSTAAPIAGDIFRYLRDNRDRVSD
ncbi:MAG: penicillin-binding protein 2 [Clostridia bacterium]|nr:penicillin-binding protein 2 [Clostridia bacterium]